MDSAHEANFEREHNRRQTQFARHHQVGQDIAESAPAETALLARMAGNNRPAMKKRVVEQRTPVRKVRISASRVGSSPNHRNRPLLILGISNHLKSLEYRTTNLPLIITIRSC